LGIIIECFACGPIFLDDCLFDNLFSDAGCDNCEAFYGRTFTYVAVAGAIISFVYAIGKAIQEKNVEEEKNRRIQEYNERKRNEDAEKERQKLSIERQRQEEEAVREKQRREAETEKERQRQSEKGKQKRIGNANDLRDKYSKLSDKIAKNIKEAYNIMSYVEYESKTIQENLWETLFGANSTLQRLDDMIVSCKKDKEGNNEDL